MNCKNAVKNLCNYLHESLDRSEFCETVLPLLEVQRFEKMTAVLEESLAPNHAFWLQSGHARYFIVNTNSEGEKKEVTVEFCEPGKILFVRDCFLDGQMKKCTLQFAAGTVIIPLKKAHFVNLKWDVSEFASFAFKMMTSIESEKFKRTIMMKMKPRDKYKECLRIFGVDIELSFAAKHIASYLGMQPSYLSRLRAESLKNKIEVRKYLQIVFFIMGFI